MVEALLLTVQTIEVILSHDFLDLDDAAKRKESRENMKLIISDAIRSKYPDLRIGIVVASNVNNQQYQDGLEKYCNKKFGAFENKFYDDLDAFLSNKNVVCWQETYRSFGVNPKKKKPTAEALLIRTLKNGHVPHVNPAVDCYLIAETIHYLPIGGYDLDTISGNISLCLAKGGEEFRGVGSDTDEAVDAGEVIYIDDQRVLTRRWNYKDAEATKIDVGSANIALFVEAPSEVISDQELLDTMNEIEKNLSTYCGASVSTILLNKGENAIDIR